MNIAAITMTKEGIEKFKKEYKQLLNDRPEAVKHLKRARELGDLSENAYYKASRAKLSLIDSRLFHLKYLLRSAKVTAETTDGLIRIGSRVVIRQGNIEKSYRIVSKYEADPQKGYISDISPIGKALIGKKKGDSAIYTTPSGRGHCTIVNVSASS